MERGAGDCHRGLPRRVVADGGSPQQGQRDLGERIRAVVPRGDRVLFPHAGNDISFESLGCDLPLGAPDVAATGAGERTQSWGSSRPAEHQAGSVAGRGPPAVCAGATIRGVSDALARNTRADHESDMSETR